MVSIVALSAERLGDCGGLVVQGLGLAAFDWRSFDRRSDRSDRRHTWPSKVAQPRQSLAIGCVGKKNGVSVKGLPHNDAYFRCLAMPVSAAAGRQSSGRPWEAPKFWPIRPPRSPSRSPSRSPPRSPSRSRRSCRINLDHFFHASGPAADL